MKRSRAGCTRKKWKDLHIPMRLSLSPQQPSGKSLMSLQVTSALSSPAHQPGAHGVKACLQVPSHEDHETRSVLGKESAWHSEPPRRSRVHRALDFPVLLIFILSVVQPTQRISTEGQPRNASRLVHPVPYGTASHVRIPRPVLHFLLHSAHSLTSHFHNVLNDSIDQAHDTGGFLLCIKLILKEMVIISVRQGWFRLQNKHLAVCTAHTAKDLRGGVGTSKFLGPTVRFREPMCSRQAGNNVLKRELYR